MLLDDDEVVGLGDADDEAVDDAELVELDVAVVLDDDVED